MPPIFLHVVNLLHRLFPAGHFVISLLFLAGALALVGVAALQLWQGIQLFDQVPIHARLNAVLESIARFLETKDAGGYRSSASRRLGIRLFAGMLSRIVGRPITDPTSGLRMTDRRGIELFARDYPHDYPEVEALVLSHAHRLQGDELPVRMRARVTGRSSIGSTQSVYYMMKVLLAVIVGLMRARPGVEAGDAAPIHAEHGI